MRFLIVAAALAAAACTAQNTQAPPAEPPAPAPAAAVPAGPPQTLARETEPGVVTAAYVSDVDWIGETGVKIFATVGGDPAINGLYTYVSRFEPPDEMEVYKIGDFEEYTLESHTATEAVLAVRQSRIDEKGEVVTESRRIIVSLPQSGGKEITVTPAK
jgi:hypothetical protein